MFLTKLLSVQHCIVLYCVLPCVPWQAPLELFVVTALISIELGAGPAFAGIAALLALIPLQGLFGRFFVRQRQATVKFTDSRVKTTGEVLQGILALKMFAWEEPFTCLIHSIRQLEKRQYEHTASA